MDPLSKKSSLLRYAVVLVVMCAIAIGFRGFKPTSVIGVLFFALVSLKYPFFDYLVRMTRRSRPTLKILPWLWVGYVLAASVDIGATWVTMSDEGGASFALWVAILISPCFLAVSLVLMMVQSQAKRSPKRS